jgi:polysaccharide biosynthesis protein PslG
VAPRRLIFGVLASALTLAVPAAAARTPAPSDELSRSDRVGISTSTVWLPPSEGYAYLQRARAAGIGCIREDFTWSAIEPVRGRFRWFRTDALMQNAARLGIKVLAIATYAPDWASGYSQPGLFAPANPNDYAVFVRAIADRYGKGGTFWRLHRRIRPNPLTAIELWNEPWVAGFWGPSPDPVAYARVVRAAATAVKAAHPGIQLLASADVPEESAGVGKDWFVSTLRADPALWRSGLVNAWSVHLYSHNLSPWNETAPPRARFDRLLLTQALARQAGADKPLWITEFGWRTDAGNQDSVSEQVQADYVRAALKRVANDWPFVRRSFVFTWAKPSLTDSANVAYNLVRPDGSAKPAWAAIQAFVATGS